MKELHDKVNIVPVIGKSDTLTKAELDTMKARVSHSTSLVFKAFTKYLYQLL